MRGRDAITRAGEAVSQIVCVIPQDGAASLRRLIESLGIGEMSVQPARRTLLRERRTRSRGATPLSEQLVEVVRFNVASAAAPRLVATLADGVGFGEPGRGSIVSRRLALVGAAPSSPASDRRRRQPRSAALASGLASLCCIVPRGVGASIARVALEAGLGVPVVAYGRGVGKRGRLGLIRVTIPVEKEIVTITLSRHDIGEAFRLVTEVMQIDRPGAGFCYWYPLERGILDQRIWVGRQPYVASMEQVIAALDVVTGDTAWRRKADRAGGAAAARSARLACYTIHGTEGDTEELVNAALAAGAGGATLVKLRRERFTAAADAPSAHEASDLIVAASQLGRIHAAVRDAGLVARDGFAEVAEVGGASGYRAP